MGLFGRQGDRVVKGVNGFHTYEYLISLVGQIAYPGAGLFSGIPNGRDPASRLFDPDVSSECVVVDHNRSLGVVIMAGFSLFDQQPGCFLYKFSR